MLEVQRLSLKIALGVCFVTLIFFSATASATTTLVPLGSTWKYVDDGSNQGTAWYSTAFSDTSWKSGPAQLGYGDGDEATVIGYGPDPQNKYITSYFRKTFSVSDISQLGSLTLKIVRDDGAVVYINGNEVYRTNMPTGTISYTTLAASSSGSTVTTSLDQSALVNGTNVIAVEVHQYNKSSSDLSFDLQLTAADAATTGVTRGPYLQMAQPTSMTVKWRTSSPTDSKVWWSKSSTSWTNSLSNSTVTTEHEIVITGLATNTKYFYQVGSTAAALSARYHFYTPTAYTHPDPVRFWIVGDSGTGSAEAKAVRDAYTTFAGTTYTDFMMLLGNSAYNSGQDSEWQSNFFNIYTSLLRITPVFPTIGENDATSSSSPYFSIFHLPANREIGGKASGTENYYSFNVGTIHVVVLDSTLSNRSTGGAMLTWLKSDLSSNDKPWLIAFWHHAPYSKGNHDSDIETAMIEMRQNANKLLEDYGVDLVFAAHSNDYERSLLIDGAYGLSSSFTSSNIKQSGSGRDSVPYRKNAGQAHAGTVYTVLGSSAFTGGGALNHPANYIALNSLGSVVLDVNCTKADAKFIKSDGTIGDYYTLRKTDPPPVPTMTSPANGSTFTLGTTITLSASVSSSVPLKQMQFYYNGTSIARDSSSPYSISWKPSSKGTYNLTAVATDQLCVSGTSSAITITVN